MGNRLISPTQSDDLRTKAANVRLRNELVAEFGTAGVDVYVLTAPELTHLWLNLPSAATPDLSTKSQIFEDLVGETPDAVVNYSSAAVDSVVLAKLGREMKRSGNILGSYRVIQREGRRLIVFSGYAGLRHTLTAPLYRVGHPKVIQMGVGRAAANAALRGGVLVTLIVSPVVRTIEWLFIDEKATLELVLARISTDVVKGVLAAGAGYASSLFLATISGVSIVAVAPLAAGIGIALVVGYGLNSLDTRLGITERLAESLVATKEEWLVGTSQIRREFDYYFFTSEGALEFIRRFTGAPRW